MRKSSEDSFTRAQFFGHDKIVRINGAIEGVPFSVKVNAAAETAEWTTPAPVSERKPAPDAGGNEADCPGCHKSLKQLVTGAIAFTKRAVGVDKCPTEEVMKRMSICETCPSGCYQFGVCRDDLPDRPETDQGCGCILPIKLQLASEACPHNHWPAVETT